MADSAMRVGGIPLSQHSLMSWLRSNSASLYACAACHSSNSSCTSGLSFSSLIGSCMVSSLVFSEHFAKDFPGKFNNRFVMLGDVFCEFLRYLFGGLLRLWIEGFTYTLCCCRYCKLAVA